MRMFFRALCEVDVLDPKPNFPTTLEQERQILLGEYKGKLVYYKDAAERYHSSIVYSTGVLSNLGTHPKYEIVLIGYIRELRTSGFICLGEILSIGVVDIAEILTCGCEEVRALYGS